MRAFPFNSSIKSLGLAVAIVASSFPALFAQTETPAESAFFRGYYLQHERNDFKKAIKEYQRSIALDPDSATRKAVDAELAEIQENLVSSDFAQLMPSDSLAYIEISQPGKHIEQVAKMMGLVGRKFSPNRKRVVLQIEDDFGIPSDFQISPALLREIKKFRGAAVAVTDITEHGPPEGVLVIHPGESDLLKGIIETGVQLVASNERIGGFPTFRVAEEVWIVKTNRMIFASTQKAMLEKCIGRISNSALTSLASSEKFAKVRKENSDAAVFAYLSPEIALSKFGNQIRDPEFQIARMIMDLDHMDHVIATLTDTSEGLQLKVNVEFDENHNSLGYGLVRTAPLSRKALSQIPADSVAVAGMGLNPKMVMAAEMAGSRKLTGLDLGREIFANIQEVGVFVMPSMANNQIPDFGLVIASSDTDKSQQLWNTLLDLPASMKIQDGPQARKIDLDGIEGRHYSIPRQNEIPDFVVARLNKNSLIAGTEGAVLAAIAATRSGATMGEASAAKPFWETTSDQTAKVLFVDVSSALEMAAAQARGREAEQMKVLSRVLDELKVSLVVDEAPNTFEARLNVNGLPMFEDVIQTMSNIEKAQRRVRTDAPHAVERQ